MTITVYTLPNCVQCDSTKKMLDKNSVPYNTVDLSEDITAKEMVLDMGYSSAPVVITDSDHWSGFRIEKLNGLIARFHG